jgi:hypothetical protein
MPSAVKPSPVLQVTVSIRAERAAGHLGIEMGQPARLFAEPVPNGQTAPYRAVDLDSARAELLSCFFRAYDSA